MLIVENRGFYLSHSITELFEDQVLNPDTANQLIKKLQSELKEYYKVSFEKYWFDKYQEKSKYIKFIVSTVEDLYIKKYSIKSFIIKFYHDGFATIESYIERNFDFANDIDTAIEDFQIDFKDKLYELVIEVSKVLEENKIIEFSKGYKYGFPSIKVDEKNYVQFNNKQDYFLQRTHFFIDSSKFDKIRRGFNDQKINFSEAVLSPYNLLILWAYCFWNKDVYSLDKDINSISSLLDIDSYTLN